MKPLLSLLIACTLAMPAYPAGPGTIVEGEQVLYVGGSIPNLKEGTIGRLDLIPEQALVFEFSGGKYEIPYKEIRAFQYSERLARRLGVVLTIAVVMVKHRQRRHFIQIAFNGADGTPQAVVFEVAKDKVQPVVAVLEARSPRPCAQTRGQDSTAYRNEGEPCRVAAHMAFVQ